MISPEHKDYLTPAGPGKLRNDATPCPRGLDFADVERWLKDAIASGQASAAQEGEFPRYAWGLEAGELFEARLCNSVLGQYKGYPIEAHEAPDWFA